MKTITPLLQNYLNGNRSALSFSGSSYINATINAPTLALSVEVWVSITAYQDFANFVSNSWSSPAGAWILFSALSGPNTIQFGVIDANGVNQGAQTINNTVGRHHLVGTFDGVNTKLYIDGALAATTPWTSGTLLGGSRTIAIGNGAPNTMYEARIYSRALSATEVAEHFTGVYKNESGRVLWLPFWDGAGTTATDFSGYGNNGTLVNAPTWVSSDLFPADTRQIRTCDLLTITPVGSSAVYYTNFDSDIVYGGNTFLSGDVKFKRGRIKLVTGVQVDNLDLELYGDNTNLIGGYGVLSACRAGVLDGARVKLDRLYMPDWGIVTLGTVNLFNGLVGTISAGRSAAKITVLSDLTILNIHMPRNVYQPGCLHTLFDSACTLVKASFAVTGTIAAGATVSGFNSNLTQADDYFTLGTMQFTSGANNGLTRSVKSYKNASGAVVSMLLLPTAPANGDTFTIYPGCDKQQATCSGKFSNLTHFRGLPFIPLPETQT